MDPRPEVSAATAALYFADWVPGENTATPLYGDQDRNFRVETRERRRFVFKVTGDASAATRRVVELQIAVLHHLARRRPSVRTPRPLPTRAGEPYRVIADAAGRSRVAWALSWLDGSLLAAVEKYDDGMLESIGHAVAEVDRALLDFEDHRAERKLAWDLARLLKLREFVPHVAPGARQSLIESILDEFEGELLPKLKRRPHSVIHNDGGNQHNMILAVESKTAPRVDGIIDFGDVVRTHAICGLGIAAAYATFGAEDPVAAIARVARGYHRVLPLEDADVELVVPLATARLTTTVCVASRRAALEPTNEYAVVSARPAWRVLEHLAAVDLPRTAQEIREAIDAAD